MSYERAVEVLRGWTGEPVVVHMEPETTTMTGVLAELDSSGVDGVLFAVDAERLSGVAIALFRDGVDEARVEDGTLVVRQGVVTLTISRGE